MQFKIDLLLQHNHHDDDDDDNTIIGGIIVMGTITTGPRRTFLGLLLFVFVFSFLVSIISPKPPDRKVNVCCL